VRIEAQLRKRYGGQEATVDLGDGLRFDPKTFRLTGDGKTLALKNKEARLLALLLENPDRLVTYEKINAALWDFDETPSACSLRTYVKTLRSYLGKARIETVKNTGYRLVSR